MDTANQTIQESNALISYEDVAISHDGYEVIRDISFTIYPGDFVFLTGQVGSGKSSILRTIYRDLKVSKGKAKALGYDLTAIHKKQIPDLRKQLGIIFQDYKLLGDLTIEDNLAFVLRATGVKHKGEISQRIAEALSLVGLNDKKEKFPNELSGGEQQRAAIARAIINHPKVILADEPTGNLDKEAATKITMLLKEISLNGTAVIMSTHNLDLVEKYAGKVFQCINGEFRNLTLQ